ncbi:MAG TPA: hypothetical protein VKB51_07085 [bacterium]|nr:hypothetical protein [bacterium]
MNETLLSETLGEDTTTQLYRDAEGGYRVCVMALPEDGGEQVPPARSPHVFQHQPVAREEAHALYRSSAAQRYVEEAEAFPGAAA